jgi:alpha-beta hydrolase superfamily lysophospholipase
MRQRPGVYGSTLHTSGTGEWQFDLELKPLTGFPAAFGWLNAVRRGQVRLHRGLDVGIPSLVLRSDRTDFSRRYSDLSDRADLVLDVEQIDRRSPCLGRGNRIVTIQGARHDVFLSLPEAFDAAADQPPVHRVRGREADQHADLHAPA